MAKNLEQLILLFGKIIFEEFEKQPFDIDNPAIKTKTLSQLKISFNDICYLYVLEKSGQFLGLIATKVFKEVPRIEVLIEIIITPAFRGKGYSSKLYELVFQNGDTMAILGYSRNPAAVQSRYQVGNKYGFKTYFGNMSAGVSKVEALQNEAKEYFIKDDIVADFSAPQGYVFLKGEENVNSPLQEGEARFTTDNPLYEPFRQILELQKTNSKDTTVGLLVSIKSN